MIALRAPWLRVSYGLDRPVGSPPLEPVGWTEVDVGNSLYDAIVEDGGRSMWRTPVEDNESQAYVFADGDVRMLEWPSGSKTSRLDPITAWELSQGKTMGTEWVKEACFPTPIVQIILATFLRSVTPRNDRLVNEALDIAEDAIWNRSRDNIERAISCQNGFAPAQSKPQIRAVSWLLESLWADTDTWERWALFAGMSEIGFFDDLDFASLVRGVVPSYVLCELLVPTAKIVTVL